MKESMSNEKKVIISLLVLNFKKKKEIVMMKSLLDIDPEPEEPPEYKIHYEKKGWRKVWVVTREDKLQTVMSDKALAQAWVSKQQLNRRRRV